MRKFLLLIAVALFSFGVNAQDALWNTSIPDVSAEEALDFNSPATMDKDGNLYVTGTQRASFDFGSAAAEVQAMGAYIAKYNAQGVEQYAISLQGNITITAITTDAENNLYVAGSYSDQAYITDVEGLNAEYEIIGAEMENGAFLAKYDAQGNLLTVKTYKAVLPLEEYLDEFWGELMTGINGVPYYGNDPVVSISKIVVEGSKVYAQFDYTGDVVVDTELKLVAKYLFVWGMAYKDASNIALISFDSTLANPSNVAVLAVADVAADVSSVHSFNFAVEGENIYVAAFAGGSVVLTTSAGNEAFDFVIDDVNYTQEEGVILANIGKNVIKLSNTLNEGEHTYYNIIKGMEIVNGNIYIAGTYNNSCAFDNSKVAVGASDVFVASVNAETLAVNSVAVKANDEGATNKYFEEVSGVVFGNESVYVISGVVDMNGEAETAYNNYNVAHDGTVNVATVALAATTVAYNDNAMALINCTGETAVSVYSKYEFTAIEDVVAENENAVIYDITGRRVNEITEAGIYIVNGKKVLVK